MKPAHRVCGGIFTPDPATPADPLSRQQVCRCGLVGEPGDAHHPDVDVPEDGQMRAAGEKGGET